MVDIQIIYQMMDSRKKRNIIFEGDLHLEIEGFRFSYCKTVLTLIGVLLTCGFLWVVMSLKKRFYMFCTHIKCNLEDAETILITDNYKQDFVVKVIDGKRHLEQVRFFYFRKLKYQWNENESTFVSIGGLQIPKCSAFHECVHGLTSSKAGQNLNFYGKNTVHIKVKPVVNLILREIVNPFYMYQVFIVTVWFLQYYYQFGICIIILSILSVSATVWETRKQNKSLRDAMKSETSVAVLRDGKEQMMPSENLVPGDAIILPQGSTTIPCDCILISGECVVNESMLTGESVPITKVPVPNDEELSFSDTSNKRSILSSGTELLLSRKNGNAPVKAIVYRTGFYTAKGELVRAILYPKPVKIKLHTDLLKCMVIFFILGIPALIYTGIVTERLEAYTWDVALFLLNVVTFFVPPALPAVLTSINEQAQRRLRKKGIFCLNTRYINVAGGLDIVCFDKTGTLTEDTLDISVFLPSIDGEFKKISKQFDLSAIVLEKAVACCHSLTNIDGKLAGYDMDIKLFKSVSWELKEPTYEDVLPFDFLPSRIVYPLKRNDQQQNLQSIALLRLFPFDSVFKRMSVVTLSEGSHTYEVFCKGAPEIVMSLCQKKTVPFDAYEILESYSSKGFRVVGFASKTLSENVSIDQIQKRRREEFEKNMIFLGLVAFENKLKTETTPEIKMLRDANVRLIMVTGDNLLTAVTVSKNCNIVEETNSVILVEAKVEHNVRPNSNIKLCVTYKYVAQSTTLSETSRRKQCAEVYVPLELDETYNFAMEGETFNLLRIYDTNLLIKLVLRGSVFARMSPDNKLKLIEILQNLGYQVGMCGDGANDCGALKTAHVGISLSMAEASVAAPFTSTKKNISCISTLIREGRATLVSTFDAFRYMTCYTFMFLVAILMLQWDGQRPSDGAYVLIDVILNLTPPFLFGATGAYHGLSKRKPTRSILSFIPLFSILTFMFIQISTISFAYEFCLHQSWYEAFTFEKHNSLASEASYSGTTILRMNMMSYITAAIIFASGRPFRNSFFSNKLYVSVIVVQLLLVTLIFLNPPEFLLRYLNFREYPTFDFNLKIFAFSLTAMLFCFIWEKCFIQRFLSNYLLPIIKRKRGPVKKYEKYSSNLEEWHPMLSQNNASNGEGSNVICSSTVIVDVSKKDDC